MQKYPFLSLMVLALYLSCQTGDRVCAAADWKKENNDVFAIGTAVVEGGNEAAARKEAISKALAKGVEYFIVQSLGSRNIAENFSRVTEDILPRAADIVGNYNIIAEDLVGTEYRVFVKMNINEALLTGRFRAAGLFKKEGTPVKVLFLMSQAEGGELHYWWKNPEVPSAMNASELVFNNEFRERGFDPVSRTERMPPAGHMEELTALNLSDAAVISWGRIVSADAVVFGETRIVNEEIVSLRVKVFNVKDGSLIFQTVEAEPIERGFYDEKVVVKSIGRLVSSVSDLLAPVITRSVSFDQGDKNAIMMTLKGLNSYRQYRVFRDFLLNEIKGVKSVKQTRVRSDSISITVEFLGSRNKLLDLILGHENIPFNMSLEQDTGGEVLLNME